MGTGRVTEPETGAGSTSGDLRAAKAELRTQSTERRRALSAGAGPEAGTALAAIFPPALIPAAGTVVSGYWPIRDEIDPRPLLLVLHGRGCLCALPTVSDLDQPLVFRRWTPDAVLAPGRFGVMEPGPKADVLDPAVLLVPLLAFDAAGFRLGYGAGFYDRSLKALRTKGPVVAIGLAFAGQEVTAVPHDDDDEPLDWLVSEAGARTFETAGAGADT